MDLSFNKIFFFFLFLSVSVFVVSCSEDENLEPIAGSNNGNSPDDQGPIILPGCMDTTACNFNEAATEDDGSCDFSCLGCTDATAFNYDEVATIDDGSCQDASEIMQNTWTLESDCDGFLADFVVPGEVTIEAGENPGELIINLAAGFVLEGSVNSNGVILLPAQQPIMLVTVSGAGSLIDNQNASVFLTISTVLGSENCTITFSL